MAFKAVLFCASTLLVQSISGLCANRISVPSCGCSSGNILATGNILPTANTIISSGNVFSSGPGCSSVVSNNGGAFNVQSVGPIAPSGIATATELALAAELAISGTVPFLSAVAFDGTLPTSGSGSVTYGCGDGNIAITQEIGNPGGSNAASTAGLALGNLGLGSCGCRCRI